MNKKQKEIEEATVEVIKRRYNYPYGLY